MKYYYQLFFRTIIAINICVLALAFGISYYYNLSSCKLCHYQQYIFFSITLLAIIGVCYKRFQNFFGALIVILYLGNTGISLYQVLMEEGYVESSTSCTGMVPLETNDFEKFKTQLLNNDFVPCDQPSTRLLGLSLAAYSLISSTVLFLFSLIFVSVFTFFRRKDEDTSWR